MVLCTSYPEGLQLQVQLLNLFIQTAVRNRKRADVLDTRINTWTGTQNILKETNGV